MTPRTARLLQAAARQSPQLRREVLQHQRPLQQDPVNDSSEQLKALLSDPATNHHRLHNQTIQKAQL